MNRFALALGLALGSALPAAHAWAAPFQNGSFETGGVVPCNTFNVPATSTLITGWTVSVGNIDWLGSLALSCGWQASSGVASLDLVGSGANGIGGIAQTFDTVPGVTYQVLFDLAGNPGGFGVNAVKPLDVTINGVTTSFTFDTTGKTGSNMGWVTRSLTFVATGASSTIDFVSNPGPAGSANAGAALDNVRIAPYVDPGPVPLGWAHWAAAMGILFASMLLLKRRRAPQRSSTSGR
jgi:choice-of-anchor C domain-containing protein